MSTSYGTSLNQSTESATSSMLRSGLNISVGDTKSIVLALQALQQKIRALEQDRDFHQEQYDRAIQAHEAYKLDMERQAEKERADHHRREEELMAMLQRAREEKVKLETAMQGGRTDLDAFRAELEAMIAEEKSHSEEREGKLRGEIARLRNEIAEERTKHAALLVALEKLRAEREAAYDTNDELRAAIADLERLRRETVSRAAPTATSRSGRSRSAVSRSGGGRGRPAPPSPAKSHASRSRLGGHTTYRDPTCSSRLRDVRTTEADAMCSCDNVVPSDIRPPPPRSPHTRDRSASTSATRSRNTSAIRTRPTSQQPEARRGAVRAAAQDVAGEESPMAHVEAQLREELDDLQHEYDNTIARAAAEKLPRNVVNTALERISELIDKKERQLRLMQVAMREVGGGGGKVSGGKRSPGNSPDTQRYSPSDDGAIDKAAQRATLVNELRALLGTK